MKRLQVILSVLVMAALLVVAPLAQGQEDSIGYNALWWQWRLGEIQAYDTSAQNPQSVEVRQSNALSLADAWRVYRLGEIRSYGLSSDVLLVAR